MTTLFQTTREPKTLELQKTDDGRYRLLITLKKLGAVSALEYFLDEKEAVELGQVLLKMKKTEE
jgi:hypothetical protein